MPTRFRKYKHDKDFLRIRDFLVHTFSMTRKPLNWRMERWNYAYYYIVPMLVTEGVGEPDMEAVGFAIQLWNDLTGVWVNQAGDIIGVVNIEHADKNHSGWGEAFIQRNPDFNALISPIIRSSSNRVWSISGAWLSSPTSRTAL